MSSPLVPADKSISPPPTVQLGGRAYVLETACAYKVSQILSLLSQVSDEINLPAILADVETLANPAGALTPANIFARHLPRLVQRAPDALVRAIAVTLIPNTELASLYTQPGAIARRVDEEMAFLYTSISASELLVLATRLIPLFGLDSLKNALGGLIQAANVSLSSP